MKTMTVVMAAGAVLALACGSSDEAEQPPVPQEIDPEMERPNPPADPLAGKSLKEICEDTGLQLVKWDFDALQADFRGLCCGPDGLVDEPWCELDWPFSDVPSCDAYDGMRNHVFARYGYDFQDARWEKEFEGRDWYVQRPDFDESWLSPEAVRNVAKLKQLKADKVGCMD